MIGRIEGYLLIPHELLHVVGYRLVGKRCCYRWGERYVTPLDSMTRRERLVGLLFLFIVCSTLSVILLILAGISLYQRHVLLALILGLLATLAYIYTGASFGDLRQAYLLIWSKPKGSASPLDFLFFPATTEHPNVIRTFSVVVMLVCLVLLYFNLT